MRFVTYEKQGERGLGVFSKDGREIISLSGGEGAFSCMQALIDAGDAGLALARAIARDARFGALPLSGVKLLAPLPRPKNDILCVGRNYLEHLKETGTVTPMPTHPIIFSKRAVAVIGPEEVVDLHGECTGKVDYEGEVAVVIGRKAKNVPEEEAMRYVFGYTIINDVTARDIQKRHFQWLIGKSLDTFCPMGPCITHASAMPGPATIDIITRVDGEIRQRGNTGDLIFSIPRLISLLSRHMTLEAGDIIATGTPRGVGAGFTPPRFLRRGDTVEITVSGVGSLRNTFR